MNKTYLSPLIPKAGIWAPNLQIFDNCDIVLFMYIPDYTGTVADLKYTA